MVKSVLETVISRCSRFSQFLDLLGTGMAPGGKLANFGLFWGMFSSPSSSGGGGGMVLGMSQSSVGGTTHLKDLRSNTNMAGHL